jgi:hypothetical protein
VCTGEDNDGFYFLPFFPKGMRCETYSSCSKKFSFCQGEWVIALSVNTELVIAFARQYIVILN